MAPKVPKSPQTKLCRLSTTFTEVHSTEVAETLSESGINQYLTRHPIHSSQYGKANIFFCQHERQCLALESMIYTIYSKPLTNQTFFRPIREEITLDQSEEEIILQSLDPVWDLLFTWGHSRSPSTPGSQVSPVKNTEFWCVWGVSGECLGGVWWCQTLSG